TVFPSSSTVRAPCPSTLLMWSMWILANLGPLLLISFAAKECKPLPNFVHTKPVLFENLSGGYVVWIMRSTATAKTSPVKARTTCVAATGGQRSATDLPGLQQTVVFSDCAF